MRIGYYLGAGFLSLCAVSCVNKAYDMTELQEMNTDMSFGGDQFSVPIGSLEPITLGRFIKAGDMLRLTEGKYELAYQDNQTTTIPTVSPMDFTIAAVPIAGIPVNLGNVSINDIDLPNIKIDKTVNATVVAGLSSVVVPMNNLTSPIHILYEYTDPIKRVNSILFGALPSATEGERLEVSLMPHYGEALTNGSTTIDNFTITFPYGFELAADPSDPYSGVISADKKAYTVTAKTLQTNKKFSFFVKKITFNPSLDQTQTGELDYNQNLTYSGSFTLSGTATATGGSVGISLFEDRVLTLRDGNFDTNIITADVPTQATPVEINEPLDDPSIQDIRKTTLKQRTPLHVVLDVSGLPARVAGLKLKNYTVRFPDFMLFEDPAINTSKKLVLNEVIPNNGKLDKVVYLTGFAFATNPVRDGKIVVSDQVTSSGQIAIDPINALSDTEIGNIVIKPTVTLGTMEVATIEAVIKPDVSIDPIEIKVELAADMAFLEQSVLDLTQVALQVRVENPTGVAALVGVRLIPYNSKNEPISEHIVTQMTGTSIRPNATTEFWISNTATGAPAEAVFVENLQIPTLFRILPSRIEAVLSVLPDDMSSVIDLMAPQASQFTLNYALVAPIALGKEFHLVYKERVTGLQGSLSDLLTHARGVELSIQAQNNIPLDLHLSAIALDASGNAIPVSIKTEGSIKAGTKEGGYTPSTLTLLLTEREPGALSRLDQIDMIFDGLPNENTIGVSLQERQALKIAMSAKIPGGINVNLKK